MNLLEILKKIKYVTDPDCPEGHEWNHLRHHGICNAISAVRRRYDIEVGNLHEEFNSIIQEWPKWTGSVDYPVPSGGAMNSFVAYMEAKDCWVGVYGDLRRELLDFCIDFLGRNPEWVHGLK